MKAAVVVAVYCAVAWTAALALAPAHCPYPRLDLATTDGGQSFQVTQADSGLEWEDFRPVGCNRRPSGSVDVGDELTNCGGSVTLDYMGLQGRDC